LDTSLFAAVDHALGAWREIWHDALIGPISHRVDDFALTVRHLEDAKGFFRTPLYRSLIAGELIVEVDQKGAAGWSEGVRTRLPAVFRRSARFAIVRYPQRFVEYLDSRWADFAHPIVGALLAEQPKRLKHGAKREAILADYDRTNEKREL